MKSAADQVQRLRLGENQLLVALDSATQQLLKLQELGGHRGGGGRRQQTCPVDASFFGERDALQVGRRGGGEGGAQGRGQGCVCDKGVLWKEGRRGGEVACE